MPSPPDPTTDLALCHGDLCLVAGPDRHIPDMNYLTTETYDARTSHVWRFDGPLLRHTHMGGVVWAELGPDAEIQHRLSVRRESSHDHYDHQVQVPHFWKLEHDQLYLKPFDDLCIRLIEEERGTLPILDLCHITKGKGDVAHKHEWKAKTRAPLKAGGESAQAPRAHPDSEAARA